LTSVELVHCFREGLAEKRAEIERLLRTLMDSRIDPPWASFEWQKIKYIIARCISHCLCQHGCKVYLLEMHGGEPSEGIGDKDIDLAIDCPLLQEDIDALEKEFEKTVLGFLGDILGDDARKVLKVPNIVELHSLNEFIIKKHVRARNQHYAIDLC